jgi:hypothetical protein
MRRVILPSILVVAGLLSVVASREAAAAPVTTAVSQALPAFNSGLLSEVYYYHGRYYPYRYGGHYYPYRYGGHYYNHRAYRNGHWRYY